ncbi:hypothetical protein D4764_01G0016550 [Takifugu flavidus]|uniref:Alkylated DNA repair protein AlkB homologue 8 N-terminal domain-containing protein n=1 Tax=Takifugu flavidus TaxID=433684 RepID=A0A5C6PTR4_9TELE|nr:hypothetical protein D4764_01G0016550 [Takifugu flavidus]
MCTGEDISKGSTRFWFLSAHLVLTSLLLVPSLLCYIVSLISSDGSHSSVAWISSYLTDRLQFVRMKDITSDTVVSSIGAPLCCPPPSSLCTPRTSVTTLKCVISRSLQMTQPSLDVSESHNNSLQLNTSKTKELVIDFGRDRPRPRPVQIGTEEVEGVQVYKYLGLWLDNRLDWTSNTRQLYKKTQSRMYFLRRVRSFNISRKLLWMFYQSVVASILSYAVVCWGGGV